MVFSGRVQGVGFRATTRKVAVSHGLTGWVRNEADGTVLAELQGGPERVDLAMAEIPRKTWGTVASAERSSVGVVEGESGFEIHR